MANYEPGASAGRLGIHFDRKLIGVSVRVRTDAEPKAALPIGFAPKFPPRGAEPDYVLARLSLRLEKRATIRRRAPSLKAFPRNGAWCSSSVLPLVQGQLRGYDQNGSAHDPGQAAKRTCPSTSSAQSDRHRHRRSFPAGEHSRVEHLRPRRALSPSPTRMQSRRAVTFVLESLLTSDGRDSEGRLLSPSSRSSQYRRISLTASSTSAGVSRERAPDRSAATTPFRQGFHDGVAGAMRLRGAFTRLCDLFVTSCLRPNP